MSMTETPDTPAPAAPRKRRYVAKRKMPLRAKAPNELAGLTVTACCTACNAERCAISGKPYCAHPHKGGLQGSDTGNVDAVGRFKAAKKLLGKRKVELENA